MKTLEVKIFSRIMKVNINIDNNGVIVTTYLDNNRRSSYYGSVEEAINGCTIKAVAQYLKTIN